MSRTTLALLCTLIAPGATPAGDPTAGVRAVFSAKCAACHGPTLTKPKGRFGYVLDLARVANNRELVVPGAPDQSELWELVRRGEMPPDDSPAGALSAEQKEMIRAWIAAGAPAPTGDVPQTAAAMAAVASGGRPPPSILPLVHTYWLSRTTFPTVSPFPNSSWASAACSNGSLR